MERLLNPESSLTEATRQRGAIVVVRPAGGVSMSNARTVPYAEVYRHANAVQETPAQRIQRAADEEAARDRRST